MNYFFLKELIGSLMNYEMTYKAHDEYKNNFIKNKNDIPVRTKEDHLGEKLSDDNDDDLALLTRRFKKILKKE